jgi:hypothetical protein
MSRVSTVSIKQNPSTQHIGGRVLLEGLATVVVVVGMAVAPLPILALRFPAQLVELAMGLMLCLFPLQVETVLVVVPIVVVLVFAVIDPVVVAVVVPVLKR